ncbi:MAG TPA: glycosyltransferase family 2 protein [Opitutales bacterium]|nr:glycosyltransferase family 2 protein [Opitutales bacterium]
METKSSASGPEPSLGFVIPVYNEEASLVKLHQSIHETCQELSVAKLKICFVDDGSTDGSWEAIERLCKASPETTCALKFRRNFGKADALQAGFSHMDSDIIITMDADLQDDPKEIGNFLEALDSGYDMVSGWKKVRYDPVDKTLPSKIFNALARAASGVPLHDFNCGFKAYRREVTENIQLFGELHRFIPILAHAEGFRIGEIPVTHHPRTHGFSKYGSKRFVKGLLDLITVVVIGRYMQRPAHIFGGFGLFSGGLGFSILAWLSFSKLMLGNDIGNRPLFFLGILLVLLGTQFVSLGLIAEMITRQRMRDNTHHITASIQVLNANNGSAAPQLQKSTNPPG